MAFPLALGAVMIGSQLIGGLLGFAQQHENSQLAEKMMAQMRDRDRQVLAMFGQAQGGGFPPGVGYPMLQG